MELAGWWWASRPRASRWRCSWAAGRRREARPATLCLRRTRPGATPRSTLGSTQVAQPASGPAQQLSRQARKPAKSEVQDGSSKGERLLRLQRPTNSEIAACLSSADQPFSYSEVGATKALSASLPGPSGGRYDFDHREFPIGTGRELFERARDSLMAWRHLEIPWLEFHGASTPARPGQVVATLVSVAGFWFFNPCRVVYIERPQSPADVVAFAYGTLPGHAECGEERFQVSFNATTGEVKYQIAAFSRPAIALSKLGYPIARRLQRRFAESSARALARAAV